MRMLLDARSRRWLIGGALLSVMAGTAILVRTRVGANHSQAPHGARRPAVGALQEGRFDRAFAHLRGLDQADWTAEDCLALGRGLLARDRIVLGWTALEAGRRLDAEHGGVRRALDGLEARLAEAQGQERRVLQDAVSLRELLCSIKGGAPLGLFVLGLALYASEPGPEQDLLDRLMASDRALLRGVTTPAGSIRLLARLLLATGRPAEAGELLQPLLSASSPLADREAAWLSSRVALQLDQTEIADAMRALAGDYGRGVPSGGEPAPFVGSERCSECHRRLYREQQSRSRHALTFRFGSGLRDVPLPESPVPDPVIATVAHRFTRRGDDRIELETRASDRVIKGVVAYALGSGQHGITMIASDEAGSLRELRLSYFPQSRAWGRTKGIDFAPRDAGDHLGMWLSPRALDHCLHCHTTWFRSVERASSPADPPERRDHGIGCERCHGPGLNHVKSAETGFAELAIALTATTTSRERLFACIECHAADGSVPPGDPEFTRAQGTTLQFSHCFTASASRLDCTTCHDPHRPLETTAGYYEAKCLSCHGSPVPGRGAATVSQSPRCPVNAREQCITCHMPKVADPSRHSRFTDHHIRVHRESSPGSALETPERGTGTATEGVP